MLKQQDTELGGLCPSKDYFRMAADGTQGGYAARAPFTEPEQHTDAASKLKNTPVTSLEKLHLAKRCEIRSD